MNIKFKIIKIQMESLRSILNILLNFKKPTHKLCVSCSQKLDKVIVTYYKFKIASDKAIITDNKALFISDQISPIFLLLGTSKTFLRSK